MRRALLATAFVCFVGVLPAAADPIIQLETQGTNPSGQFFAEFRIQDPIGLAELTVIDVMNSILSVTGFFFGTTDPVFMTATTISQTQPALIAFQATNLAGESTVFQATLDPVTGTVTSAVPEPASLTLLAFGLAGVGAHRWRQRRG